MSYGHMPVLRLAGLDLLYFFVSLDRMRGVEGTRDLLLINLEEMRRLDLGAGQVVSLVSDAGDGVHRGLNGLRVTPFALPDGCLGAYYPEANPLIPLWYHDQQSQTPAGKAVPVRIRV